MLTQDRLLESDLDGQEAGGFVLLNLDPPTPRPYQVLDENEGGYYRTLAEAREACQRVRQETGNSEIYVYALAGVSDAVTSQPGAFVLS